MQIAQTIKNVVKKTVDDFNIPTDMIPGTKDYDDRKRRMEAAQTVFTEWSESETIYNQVVNRITKLRDFYLGEKSQQWSGTPDGSLQLVVNLGATIVDLFTYLMTNNPPQIQIIPSGTGKTDQLRGNYYEDQARKIFQDAKFPLRFRDGVKNQVMLGFSWLYPFWNTLRKDGGSKGTYDLTNLNPFTTRVKFSSSDFSQVDSFITTKRLTPAKIKEIYNFDAIPDTDSQMLPRDFISADDDMTTVFRRYGQKDIITVINGREVGEREVHGFDRCPLYVINNITAPNDMVGHSEIERWQGLCQEINALLTAVSEIARDVGYPALLEYNNALGGRNPKLRGNKIPVKRSDAGEALAYLNNPATIEPLIKQTQFLIELLHFIALMPKAAAGIFSSSVTSGYQAQLSMQPATLTTNNRKLDWEEAIKQMLLDALVLIKRKDPGAFIIDLEDGKKFVMPDLFMHEIKVTWPENLPVDIAREVQNLVMGIQNNLTSIHQAVDKYNALMDMGTPSDTFDYLKQESNDPELSPERTAKIATLKQQLQQLDSNLQGAQGKLQEMRKMMNDGEVLPENLQATEQAQNPVNLARSAGQPLPGEGRAYPQNAREAVNPNSTGGKPVLPVKTQG